MNLPDGYLLQDKKYRLSRTIGQGGFGITYLGVWNTEVKGGLGVMKTTVPVCIKEYFFKDYCYRDKNTFAVKVHSDTGEKLFGKFKEKLIEEANILSAVHHPNIVNVLEVFSENNTAYIVMEYIKGFSLRYLLDNKGVLSENKVIKYTHQIGNALNYVHEKNILHLDIKPGNILIDHEDNARLIDFGVSKRFDIEEQETSTTTLTLSKGFAAIEQYDHEGMLAFSPAPDIYSLGATMYNLLTGVVPVESILRVTKQMLPPSAYNSNISQKTEKAILKAMEIKPKDRFRKVNELLVAIDTPVYEISDEKTVETNSRIDDEDQTGHFNEPTKNLPEDEDDKTIINTSNVSKSKRKRKPRQVVRRRVLLTIAIILCSYIGYAVYSYFTDNTSFQGTITGFNMPDDVLPVEPVISLISQPDSVEQNDPDPSAINSEPSTISGQQVAVVTQNNNAAVAPPLSNKNSTPENTPQTVAAIAHTPTYTPAQIKAYESDILNFINSGKAKKSAGNCEGATNDFTKASEIAEKIGKDLPEVSVLVDECKKVIEKQAREALLAQYEDKKVEWSIFYIVTNKKTKRIGAIYATTYELAIPCIYIDQNPSVNGNRDFYRDDNSVDIYDKNGKKVN